MSDTDTKVPLPNLDQMAPTPAEDIELHNPDEQPTRIAADLESVFDVPVQVSAVLGRSRMQVGEAVEIFVNERLVARGEIVLVDSKLGVTMTEIIKPQ